MGGESFKGNYVSLDTAERFDPKANTFVLQGTMKDPRISHAAVRLEDGRVLVAGGEIEQEDKALATAEIFDPDTGQFSPTGDMTGPRDRVRATLLQDGRVLVVGGVSDADDNNLLASAELFDPATGKFQSTGSLSGPLSDVNLVNLSDGRVAVLGGVDGNHQVVQRVEIYDPATGTFSVQGETVIARAEAPPILLPGDKILMAGGLTFDLAGSPVVQNSIEVYDSATGKSAVVGTLMTPRDGAATVPLEDGRILLAGGFSTWNPPTALQTSELLDPATGQLTAAAPMLIPRVGMTAVRLQDGRVLVLGGGPFNDTKLNPAEVYVP